MIHLSCITPCRCCIFTPRIRESWSLLKCVQSAVVVTRRCVVQMTQLHAVILWIVMTCKKTSQSPPLFSFAALPFNKTCTGQCNIDTKKSKPLNLALFTTSVIPCRHHNTEDPPPDYYYYPDHYHHQYIFASCPLLSTNNCIGFAVNRCSSSQGPENSPKQE